MGRVPLTVKEEPAMGAARRFKRSAEFPRTFSGGGKEWEFLEGQGDAPYNYEAQ